jgi:hypothetical protein
MEPTQHLDQSRRHYSIQDAAPLLGMSPQTLWRRIRTGQLSVPRVDGRFVVPASRLAELQADTSFTARRYTRTRR